MKTSFYLTTFCIVCLSIFLVWTKFEANNRGIAISVNESEDIYKFSASYYSGDTKRVRAYINHCVQPGNLIPTGNDYMDITTSLPDNTKFYIKESPGKLRIELDKTRNSLNSYMRIKNMCEGIKNLLAGK